MAVRVYQIAKEYSRAPEEVIDVLREAGINVGSHTSPLDEHALHTVHARFAKFKLTVVDGDQESRLDKEGGDSGGPAVKVKKARKKKPDNEAEAAPRLAVRVIKKHDQEEEKQEDAGSDESSGSRPRLRRPKPNALKIEERIHKLTEKLTKEDSSGSAPGETATESPRESVAAAAAPVTASAPSEPEETQADNSNRLTAKRGEKELVLPTPSTQQARSDHRRPQGEYNRNDRGPRPDGDRGPRPDGDRGPRPGGNDRGPRPAGSGYDRGPRPGGPGGDRGPRPDGDRGPRPGGSSYDRGPRPGGPAGDRGPRPPGEGYDRGPRPAGGGGGYDRGPRPPGGGGYDRGPGGGGYDRGPGGPGGDRGPRPEGDRGPRPPGAGYDRGPRPGGPGGPGGDRGPRPGGPGGYDRGPRPGGPGGSGGPGYDRGPRPGGPGGPGGSRPGGPGGPRPGGPGGPRTGGPGGGAFDKGDDRGFDRNRSGSGPGRPGGGGGGGRGGDRSGGPGGGGGDFAAMSLTANSNRTRFAQRPGSKKKKKRRKDVEQIEKIKVVRASKVDLPGEDLGIIMLSEGVTVKELSEKVNRKAKDVIKRLFEKGIMATLNDVLESELAIEIAKDFGYLAEIVSFEEDLTQQEDDRLDEVDDGTGLPRFPIVTIMGHVDHGKTTLLDAIRATKVASGEAGGITQHIGAYSVPCKGQEIVFLDTPGHEAFTKMRARGASVTDIVVLVVAADDGVKPQTIEAISHAKAAKVPIITCINKIDKPDANPERVKQMLTEHELVVEDFGGDSPCVLVSAKAKTGINDLLEMIILVAELNDYKATPSRRARGTVIEARLDRGRGPVATLIVQDGTLKIGDYFITGQTYGKIRAMHDDMGGNIAEAGPSTPVEVLGLNEVPSAGDNFLVTTDEAEARKISGFRKDKAREDSLHRHKHASLDQLFSNLKQEEHKELCVIIKADVQGSSEGLVFALNKIPSEKVHLRIIHQGVGNITENDVLLAAASDSIIIGFNVKPEPKAQNLAEQEGIEIRNYSIIYEVVKQIEAAMLGLVAPTLEERELGRAVVRQVFSVAKLGKVAGCVVENGMVKRDAHVRVMRGGNQIFEGKLQTLKRFKDDVNEVKNGYECGIGIHGFSDVQEGDTFNFYTFAEVQATEL